MVEMLQEMHQYVPTYGDDVVEKIFFGGDQLTEGRCCNAQLARSDSNTLIERLQGLDAKNEDWHVIRCAYEVFLKLFSADDAAGDRGTYLANANLVSNSNAKGPVETNYNEIK